MAREEAKHPLTDSVSSMEKCSFVCHLFIFPLGLVYILWVVLDDDTLASWNVTYYPPREWSVYMAVSALLLFLAAPILYAAFNSTTVPKLDSMDTLQDDYTRKPTSSRTNLLAQSVPAEATLPEICDLDPASLVWYPTNQGKRSGEKVD